jgi:magnesium chelatase family protein
MLVRDMPSASSAAAASVGTEAVSQPDLRQDPEAIPRLRRHKWLIIIACHVSCWFRLNWNPHPCGYWGSSGELAAQQCRCSPRQIEPYRQRISGPLLDRIDIHLEVPLVDFRELSSNAASGGKSATIRERVVAARRIQNERFRKSSNNTNAAMSPRQMKLHCQINAEATGYLEHAMEEMNFSARAHDRILKVSRTLADLAGSPEIRASDILETIQYRPLDRKLFE